MIACFSSALKNIPHLETFLGRSVLFRPKAQTAGLTAVVTWGAKDNYAGLQAHRFAEDRNLPLWRLEDGFLRSLDLGGRGSAPLSLVLDQSGIYYDAAAPSDLETLLNTPGWETPKLLSLADEALKAIVAGDLSKYNYAPSAPPGLLGHNDRPKILLLDQTLADKSVEMGLAGPENFQAMLAAASADHPGADFFIKTHPEVIAGRKQGYFNFKTRKDLTVISKNYSPLSLLAQADEVYTVTSQMGLEALFLGKPVHCFGLPFYAGWGLTMDRLNCRRRTFRRSLLELFAAAFLLYPRYVNPVTGQRTDIMEIIQHLGLQRNLSQANRGAWAVAGFSRRKRSYARAFLSSPETTIRFFATSSQARQWAARAGARTMVWSSKLEDDSLANNLVRMEDGFLRSVGLGSDFAPPYSLVMDPDGIYYDPAVPSRLENLLAGYDFQSQPGLLERAAALRRLIIEKKISKYNKIGSNEWTLTLPHHRRVILVPGQVEDDASVLRGSPEIRSNLALLAEIRRKRPESFIIYKPHPDVERGNRRGSLSRADTDCLADLVLRKVDISAVWPYLDEVHTLTSLVGFEAILRGLETHTYGGPFYAGWGLSRDRLTFPRRGRLLTLDELTAAVLILYPRYYDWNSHLFCTPEDVLSLIEMGLRPRLLKPRILWLLKAAVKKLSMGLL